MSDLSGLIPLTFILQLSPYTLYFTGSNGPAGISEIAVDIGEHCCYFIIIKLLGWHAAVIFSAIHNQLPGKPADHLLYLFFFVCKKI